MGKCGILLEGYFSQTNIEVYLKTDIILKALLSKPKEVIQKIINGYDPIDIAAAGLGHTLFHDMIHAVGKGEIGDVHEDKPGAGGIDDDDGGVAAPYGKS